jgi:hypothetical protein
MGVCAELYAITCLLDVAAIWANIRSILIKKHKHKL